MLQMGTNELVEINDGSHLRATGSTSSTAVDAPEVKSSDSHVPADNSKYLIVPPQLSYLTSLLLL